VESLACLWGQAFSLPPGFCPAFLGDHEERRLKARPTGTTGTSRLTIALDGVSFELLPRLKT
jgi:hypothetical protein